MPHQKIIITPNLNQQIVAAQMARTQSTQTNASTNAASDDDLWLSRAEEGQLAVDVYQTKEFLVIKSAVAGVNPRDLSITVDNDIVTIRGARQEDEEREDREYFYQECYFGGFSRSIILPIDVHTDKAEAVFKNGILTVKFPKMKKTTAVAITVEDTDS